MAQVTGTQAATTGQAPTAVADSSMPQRQVTYWGDVWRRFRVQRIPMVAGAVLLLLLLVAILAPVIAPFDPIEQFADGTSAVGEPLAPGGKYFLGTDYIGRDQLSRLIFGIRTSIGIGLVGSAFAISIAVLIGGLAGFAGGKVDFAVMRFVDLLMSMPTFFMMLLLISIVKPGVWVVIFVISIFSWAYPSRIFRSQMLTLREREYVVAAEAVGVPQRRIFARHLLPHLMPLVIVYLALMVPGTIFAEAGLSFVGLGVPQPQPSLGSMILQGQQYYRTAPWLVLYPGITMMLIVLSFNLFGNALRDAMDPQRRKTR